MAYIDDNNDLTAGKGKDPLKELDDELDRVMAELKEMEQKDSTDSPDDALPEPADEKPAEPIIPEQTVQDTPPAPPKKRGKAPLILAIILIVALLGAGGYFLIDRLINTKPDLKSGEKVETVAFTDSELGEITVKKVDGAALNTYDVNNLQKNDNGYYTYTVDGKVTSEVGVDLAEYQGEVDFAKVKESGVDYVILRIGGRYYSDEGKLYEDGMFDTYYEAAKAAGLKVGAYFFSQANTVEEAAEEAKFVAQKLDGRKLDYPVAFDWEVIEDDEARTDGLSGDLITAMAEKFCDTIEDEGYRSIVYASTSLMLQSYDFETMKDYDFWLADYREFPNMYYDFAMWQYATDGTVDGVEGAVDLNICFQPYT